MERVLLVIDMQNDFIDGALGTKEAASIVERMVSKINTFDGRIIATLDTHGTNYLNTAEGKKLPVPHCIRGEDGWKLNEDIRLALEQKGYQAIEKETFGSVRLMEEIGSILKQEKIEVEIAGLCTDICVVSNALLLRAHFPELPIIVDAACCAGVTPQTHRAALDTMKMCQIVIKNE